MKNPAGSFLRFVLGFFALIGVSFAVAMAMDKYALSQESAQSAAAVASVQQK
ncbi:MAG: hypothetical protein Q7S75_01925 [bacterium]|nr:hypothetical protein [bacterium]